MRASRLLLFLALVACGGSDTPAAPTKVVSGSYGLATYKGVAPPVVVLTDAANDLQIEIVSGTYDLSALKTYTSVTGIRTTEKGVVTTSSFSCSGTYVGGGNTLVFTEPESGQYCGGSFSATWDGSDALTFVFKNGDSAVFRR
jgi:hypothetical protein